MTSRALSLSATAVLALALLSGCSFLTPSTVTVNANDIANAAEDWLEDDEDVSYKVECDDEEEVDLQEDESIDCVATDKDTDLEYDVEITITDVDGDDFEVEVDRDEDANSSDDDADDDSEDSDDTGGDDVFDLVVGDCFDDAVADGEDADSIDTVDIVDCDDAHEREVYDAVDLEGEDDEYPGEDSVTSDADDFCVDAFAGFIGIDYDDSELYYLTLYPTESTWSEGDREILCLVSEYDADDNVVPVEGSLEGSSR